MVCKINIVFRPQWWNNPTNVNSTVTNEHQGLALLALPPITVNGKGWRTVILIIRANDLFYHDTFSNKLWMRSFTDPRSQTSEFTYISVSMSCHEQPIYSCFDWHTGFVCLFTQAKTGNKVIYDILLERWRFTELKGSVGANIGLF